MSRASLLWWGLMAVLIGCLGAVAGGDPGRGNPQEESRKLKDQLDQALARNRELQAQVERLQKQVDGLKHRLAVGAFEARVPPGVNVPPNWVPQRFNGITYYVVPLDTTAPAPAERSLQHEAQSNGPSRP